MRKLINNSMGKKLTTNGFIKRATKVHDNLYDYLKVEYVNAHIKVCIIDPVYGEFWQRPYDHLAGKGSAKRGYQARGDNRRCTTDVFIQKAKMIHNNIYDYSKVQYISSNTKVCIIDPEYGEFWQRPNNHLYHGCPHRNLNGGKDAIHRDHIIPISILGTRKEINHERPLYKFLDSEINIQEIPGIENLEKGDLIEYNGSKIRARDIRNNYSIIANLTLTLLDTDINSIIKEDKEFIYNA